MKYDEHRTDIAYSPEARPAFPMLGEMFVERGTKKDWDGLHHLHYKAEGQPPGAHYYRLDLHGQTIGVVALTLPRPLLKERHAVMEQLKPGHDTRLSNTARYKLINANIRVIGRIVLDTMYRGVGASYRLQNLVSRMSGYRYIEIQSAMSKYNSFAEKAGFRMARPMRSTKYETGLRFFRETFESHPADTDAILKEIDALPGFQRDYLVEEMRDFYYRNSTLEKTGSNRGDKGRDRVKKLEVEELLRQLQQLVLASPLYGVYQNPDHGRDDMPTRLPLLAFDAQKTTEPLTWTESA